MMTSSTLITGGYTSELFIDDVHDSEYVCCICHDVLRDPVEAYNDNIQPCCHLFCHTCIQKWLSQCHTCPQCRVPLTNEQLHKAVRLQRKIWQLKVKCRQHKLGCDAHGELGRSGSWWHTHEAKHCMYVTEKCQYCGVAFMRNEMDDHCDNKCKYRPVTCEHCGVVTKFCNMTAHTLNDCPLVKVPCTHNCGANDIARRDLARHVRDDCPRAVIQCVYNRFGCGESMKRSDLKAHLHDHVEQHAIMSVSTMEMLRREVDELRQLVAVGRQPSDSLGGHVRAESGTGPQQSKYGVENGNGSGGVRENNVETGLLDDTFATPRASFQVPSADMRTQWVSASRVDTLEELLHIPCRIEWSVNDWSSVPAATRLYSPVVVRNGRQWRGTVEKREDGSIGYFLRYENGQRPLYVRILLSILQCDGDEEVAVASSLTHTYMPLAEGGFQGWGCKEFATLSEIESQGGYNANTDSLTFRIEFTVSTERLKVEEDLASISRRLDSLEMREHRPLTLEWTAENWSALEFDTPCFSRTVTQGEKEWRGSIAKNADGVVSVYLRYEKGPRPLKVTFRSSLVCTKDNSSVITRELNHTYTPLEDGGYVGWGYHKFCTIDQLLTNCAYDQTSNSVTVRIQFSTK